MDREHHEIFKLQGINTDIEPIELMNGAPAQPGDPIPVVWTSCRNVHADDEATIRIEGYAGFADPLPAGAVPIFALNVLTPTTAYWIWIDGQTAAVPKVYVTDGVNHFDISPTTPLTGGLPGEWTGTILNGVPVLNNGSDAPFWWDGNTANPVETIPDWPANTVVKAIRSFKYHLIGLNTTENGVQFPDKYIWSAAADPGTIPQSWTPEPGNDAGFNTLSATIGGIIDGEKLRDTFIIYKSHSSYMMSYIAGQYVFATRKLFVTSGAIALNTIVELQGYHYVFADGDIVRHDGNTYASVVDKRTRKLIFDNIDTDRMQLCHLAVDKSREDIWINYPTIDSTNIGFSLLYSYADDAFGVRELPSAYYVASGIIPEGGFNPTWDGATTTWDTDPRRWNQSTYSYAADRLLMCGASKLYNVDAAMDADGEPIEAFVERLNWTVAGQGHIWQNDLIRAIYPVITGSPGDVIKVQVAGTRGVNQSPSWIERDYIIGGDWTKIDLFTTGRYLNVRFSSVGGAPWQIHRIGVEFVPKSKY